MLAAYPKIEPLRQTVECSVMDIADDIAYSLHDLDDFHRAGVLQHAAVAAEFRTWIRRRTEFARGERWHRCGVTGVTGWLGRERQPGVALEQLRRRLQARDGWIFDDDTFGVAVGRVATDLVDGLLAVPFDSSIAAERAIGTFTESWIAHLRGVGGGDRRSAGAGRSCGARPAGLARGRGAQVRPPAVRAGPAGPGDVPTRAGRGAHLAGGQPGVLADRPGGRRPGAPAADRPGRTGDRRVPAGGQARSPSCWSDRPGSRRPPGTTSSGSAAAAASSTTSPRSPTTGRPPQPAPWPGSPGNCGTPGRAVSTGRPARKQPSTKRRTVTGGGVAVEVAARSAGRLGEPVRRPQRRTRRRSSTDGAR